MDAGRVLITGGTGFVGRALVASFAASGRRITVAHRHAPNRDVAAVRQVVVGEIGPDTEWAPALDGADAVVHLAAHVHVAPERAEVDEAVFDRVNHLGTVRLFEAATRMGVSRFVYLSSATVLGSDQLPGHLFTDLTPTRPDTPYARSKLAAEKALVARAAGSEVCLTILRPPLICGPGVGGNLAALLRLAATPIPLPFGAVRNRRTLLSLDNLVSAIAAVLDCADPKRVEGTYLIGDPAPLSTAEIVGSLRDGLGRPRHLLPVPPALLSAGLRLAGRPGMARRLFGDFAIDSSRFRDVTGWRDLTDTHSSLRRTAASRP